MRVRFDVEALGFAVERRGPGFTRASAAAGHGAGVEIVLEVEDLESAARAVRAAGHELAEPPRDRPWGLRDLRVTDPDGYDLRATTAP